MPRPSQRISSLTPSHCRWWPTALAQHCESIHVCSCVRLYLYVCLFLCVCLLFSLSQFRTRGGFVALSPISPQELFLQPISSDVETSQQQVRKGTIMNKQSLTPQLCLKAVVPNLLDLWPFITKYFLLTISQVLSFLFKVIFPSYYFKIILEVKLKDWSKVISRKHQFRRQLYVIILLWIFKTL